MGKVAVVIEPYQIIDLNHWKRALHCQVFRNSAQPSYSISFTLDITNFYRRIKQHGYSFTLAFIYETAKCANQIEEFRYRFLDGQVILYPVINTQFTYLDQETELYRVISVPFADTMETYIQNAAKIIQNQKEYFTGPPSNDSFVFSSLPWITFTHVSHTDSGKKENAIPLFDFGKYYRKHGRILMPFSVQVHHSFVDGLHVGRFAELLQSELKKQ